jgi:hypothetical protein
MISLYNVNSLIKRKSVPENFRDTFLTTIFIFHKTLLSKCGRHTRFHVYPQGDYAFRLLSHTGKTALGWQLEEHQVKLF